MKPIRILRYGPSDSLNRLVDSLRESEVDVKKLNMINSSYRGSDDHFILNWGSSNPRSIISGSIFNKPSAVAIAANKLDTYYTLERAGMNSVLPVWFTDPDLAKHYTKNGCKVYCRTTLRGSQGEGIVVATKPSEVVHASLYTLQAPVCREVRVHVFDNKVIYCTEKRKMNSERIEEESIEFSRDVRNLENGWVFCSTEISESVQNIAIDVVLKIGLDFSAVDIGISHRDEPFIFEVNTAPGLEGTTLTAYRDAIIAQLC